MDKALLHKISAELKISPEQVFREYWEMALLKSLSDKIWSDSLGFKGGTALRLAYNSPRFSDDLDFTLLQKFNTTKLFKWAEDFAKQFSIELTDSADKRNTLLIEFRIRSNFLPQPVKQKIEISKRGKTRINNGFQLKLLTSPTTTIQVLFLVASPDLIWKEKFLAMKERQEPRDLFDLWFLSQKMKQAIPSELPKISKKKLRLTLNKYLPSSYRKIVSELEQL